MQTYDPDDIIMNFDGSDIDGLAKGVFVKASRNEESASLSVGSGGEGTLVINRNKSGKVTFTVKQGSAANDILSAKAALLEAKAGGIGPLIIKHRGGSTLLTAVNAWVTKPADVEYSNEDTTREWVLETDNLNIFVGGIA
jgi:hypothetical protein